MSSSDSPPSSDSLHDDFKVPPGYKSGYVSIIGQPNAGKSTLMNAVMGTKLSIITPKAQTTRHRITGIYSEDRGQLIFLDTPGLLAPRYKLHEKMMGAVKRSFEDADLIIFLLDPDDVPEPEQIEWIQKKAAKPVLLLINKADYATEYKMKTAEETLTSYLRCHKVMRVSALQNTGVAEMLADIFELMPEGPPFYPPDQLSEHPERFFAAELIREQLFLQYHAEIPYSCAVNILKYDAQPEIDRIEAEIVVNRNSQKGIVIGKGGKALKNVGVKARQELELFLGKKVFLNLFVKVREKWRDKDGFLKSYGYQ